MNGKQKQKNIRYLCDVIHRMVLHVRGWFMYLKLAYEIEFKFSSLHKFILWIYYCYYHFYYVNDMIQNNFPKNNKMLCNVSYIIR